MMFRVDVFFFFFLNKVLDVTRITETRPYYLSSEYDYTCMAPKPPSLKSSPSSRRLGCI